MPLDCRGSVAAWERPRLQSALVVMGLLFAWLLLSWGLQRVVSRTRGHSRKRRSSNG